MSRRHRHQRPPRPSLLDTATATALATVGLTELRLTVARSALQHIADCTTDPDARDYARAILTQTAAERQVPLT